MQFDLADFRRRVRLYQAPTGNSHVTLSKKLFTGNGLVLGKIMDDAVPDSEKTFPRLDTLVRADKRLAALEAKRAEKVTGG